MRLLWVEHDPGIPSGAADGLAGLDEAVAHQLAAILEADAGAPPAADGAPPAAVTLPATCAPVPAVEQRTGFSCGPAALLACLQYFDAVADGRARERVLYRPLDTSPEIGTEAQALVDVARDLGLEAELAVDQTLDGLQARWRQDGALAILGVQVAGDPAGCLQGHYVVLLGVDREHAYLMDPETPGGYAYVDRPDLERAWRLDAAGTCHAGLAVILRAPEPFRRPEPAPPITLGRLPRARLAGMQEGKAIGTAGHHQDGGMQARDATIRQATSRWTQPQTLKLAARNILRDMAPVTAEARATIQTLLADWHAGTLPFDRLRQESGRRWLEAYERIREIGRRASGLDRLHPEGAAALPVEETWFRSYARAEIGHWNALLDGLRRGTVSEAQAQARLEHYLTALRSLYEGSRVLALPDTTLIYWMGPKRDRLICPGCAYMVERSPFTKANLPTQPLASATSCRVNCRHWLVVRAATPTQVAERTRALPRVDAMVRALRSLKESRNESCGEGVRLGDVRAIPQRVRDAVVAYVENNYAMPPTVRTWLRDNLGQNPLLRNPLVRKVYRIGRTNGRAWAQTQDAARRHLPLREPGMPEPSILVRDVVAGEFLDLKPLYSALGLYRFAIEQEAYLLV